MAVSIRYDVTLEDYVNYQYHYIRRSRDSRRLIWLLRLLMLIVAASAGAIVSGLDMGLPVWVPAVSFFVLAVVLQILAPVFLRLVVRRLSAKQFKSQELDRLLSGNVLQLNEDELRVDNAKASSVYRLDTVEEVTENADCIYLFIGRSAALIIPCRSFESPEQKEEFLRRLGGS